MGEPIAVPPAGIVGICPALGREAATAVFEAAQAIDDLYRIWATCDTDNIASRRILEALGMTCEGRLRRWSSRPNLAGDERAPRDVY